MKHFSSKFFMLLVAIITTGLFSENGYAQTTQPGFKGHFYFQPNVGITQYFGDLNKYDFHNKKVGLGASGIIGYQISPVVGLRTQFLYGKINSEREDMNRKLKGDLFEASGQLVLNINDMFTYNPERIVNLYLFGGVGYIMEKSTVSMLANGAAINGQTDVSNNGLSFPFGGGASFRLCYNTDLNLEYGHHYTARDTEFDLTPGGKSKYDQFSYASIGLTFKATKKDSDGDGIVDSKDLCPNEYGKAELNGCPDRDNDGIADAEDECPDVAGLAQFKGCPDTDGDGIIDSKDACPTEHGKPELNGCPDRDNDGIADALDKCPDQAGLPELEGCPDRDGDGIADKDDQCPDVAGLAKYNGCPAKDTDGDGVNDEDDRCPTLAGPASNQGCPEIKKEIITKVEYVAKQIQFQTGKAVLLPVSKKKLNEIVRIMNEDTNLKLLIEGHTDNVGKDEFNQTLSENRAAAVRMYLMSQGVSDSRLTSHGYGESKPLTDNKTASGRALNRRVELHLNY